METLPGALGTYRWRLKMKQLIMVVVLATILLPLAGCLVVDRDGWGWGHRGEGHEERHEEHQERR